MRTFQHTLFKFMALALAMFLPAPSFAQSDGITVTFNLTVQDVQAGERLAVTYDLDGTSRGGELVFCGEATPCEGGGTSYTQTATVPSDTQAINYLFTASSPQRQTPLVFQRDTAAAQDGTTVSASYPADLVTLTFKLTLNGQVPADEIFTVDYPYPEGQSVGTFDLCGAGDAPACVGNGTTYTVSTQVPANKIDRFAFFRLNTAGGAELFYEDSVVTDNDKTITAYYTYGGTGTDNGQEAPKPTGLPDTAVSSSLARPVAYVLVASLLVAAGTSLRRRPV